MKLFAIFGNPVSHSRSPLMHNSVFKALGYKGTYTRIKLEDGSKLKKTFLNLKLSGVNVTVPHKEAAFNACDEIRGFANKVGVVNTIINENGKLIGYNTDADGFIYSIKEFKGIKTVLVLGAGGTAKALSTKLREEGLDVSIVNRSEGRLKEYQDDGFTTFTHKTIPNKAFDLILNTTSAGLSDENYPAPLNLLEPLIEKSTYCADAIYGKVTPFLQLCNKYNKPNKDGADMLLGQGVLASMLFTQNAYKSETIEDKMKESFLF